MAGGTYTALTGRPPLLEAVVYTPYGLVVSLVLIGKHLDKYEMDSAKGVKTLPIRLGYGRTLLLARVLSISAPAMAFLGIYIYTGSPLAALSLLAYPGWFAAWSYLALDALGRYVVASLLAIALYSGLGLEASAVAVLLTLLMGIKDLRASRWYIERFLSGW